MREGWVSFIGIPPPAAGNAPALSAHGRGGASEMGRSRQGSKRPAGGPARGPRRKRPAAVVAAELGLSVGAVYAARCRILARLREEL